MSLWTDCLLQTTLATCSCQRISNEDFYATPPPARRNGLIQTVAMLREREQIHIEYIIAERLDLQRWKVSLQCRLMCVLLNALTSWSTISVSRNACCDKQFLHLFPFHIRSYVPMQVETGAVDNRRAPLRGVI